MEKKIKQSSLFKKIMAFICAMTLVMSVSMPYAYGAASDVTQVTVKYEDGMELFDYNGDFTFEDYAYSAEPVPVSSTKSVLVDFGAEENSYVITACDSAGEPTENFASTSMFNFLATPAESGLVIASATNGAVTRVALKGTDSRVTVTLSRATGDVVVELKNPEKPDNDVTFNSGDGFAYSDITVDSVAKDPVSDVIQAKAGQVVSFKVNPAEGYVIDSVTADNGTRINKTGDVYSFTVGSATEINVATKYQIKYDEENSNTYSIIKGKDSADLGDSYQFTLAPKAGYDAPQVVITSGGEIVEPIISGNTYAFAVQGATTIKITGSASQKTYDVSLNNASGADKTFDYVNVDTDEALGSKVTVSHGGTVSFRIKPVDGYNASGAYVILNNTTRIDAVDGVFTISDITANASVEVRGVERTRYQINVVQNNNEAYTVISDSINDGKVDVTYGSRFTFRVIPAEGYQTPVVKFNDTVLTSSGSNEYVTPQITSDSNTITIDAGAKKPFNVTLLRPDGAVYTFGGYDNLTVAEGGVFKFTVEASERYDIANAKVTATNGDIAKDPDVTNGYILSNVTADTTIRVTDVLEKTFSVSGLTAADGYTVTGAGIENGEAVVTYNSNYTFYVRPMAGYNAPEVKIEGAQFDNDGNGGYTLLGVKSNVAVTIGAAESKQYAVKLYGADGCTFTDADGSPLQNSSVAYGASFAFKLALDESYSNSKPTVEINGEPISADSNGVYRIENITADIIVRVGNVNLNTYHVTLTADDGAVVNAVSGLDIVHGGNFNFNISLNAGYVIDKIDIKGNNTQLSATGGSKIVENVTNDITIHVSVKKIAISYDINAGQSQVNVINDSIQYGDTVKFTVTPNEYYKVTHVYVNGIEYGSSNGEYTVANVTSNMNISVQTEAVKLTVNFRGNGYYDDETVTFTYAGESTVNLSALKSNNALYMFDYWTVDEGALDFDKSSDKTIRVTANWKVDAEYVAQNITLTTQHMTYDGGKVVLRTYINVNGDLATNEKFANAQITGYGTLVTKTIKDDSSSSEWTDYITKGNGNHNANSTALQIEQIVVPEKKVGIVNYYHINQSIALNEKREDNFIRLTVNNLPVNSLESFKAAGWIELNINGEKVIIISEWDSDLSKTNDNLYHDTTAPDEV